MHGTDVALFMGLETTKLVKLLEREINFFSHPPENRILMLLCLKKTKWIMQERKF